MTSSAVFSRYARSLADVVLGLKDEAAVDRDLRVYCEIFRAVPNLLDTFHNPAIPRDVKHRILSELLASYPVSRIAGNFLKVLLDHNRIRYFQEIFDLYAKTVNERKGIITAQVVSAAPLSDGEMSALRESMSRTTGKDVILDLSTDKELLGGLVVRVGSTVYDGSVRRHLVEMRQRLME
jgi:F-type H+-transporting ATPase subunit delta